MSLFALPPQEGSQWVRRARPVLGTLVDIGVPVGSEAALHAAFEVMQQVQQRMSVFEPDSDLSRSHAAAVGEPVAVHAWTAEVLQFAHTLQTQSAGLFDVALGSGSWQLEWQGDQACLIRHQATTRIDLGGLAKGWAVDKALETALEQGASAVWVNAGGDLRVHGLTLPLVLRDECSGGVRPWAELQDGAMATSDFRAGARSRLSGQGAALHLSVLAPRCAWADALTKVLAQCRSLEQTPAKDLLQHYQAQAWAHDPS